MANILEHKYFNLNNWVKNMTSFPVFINTYVGGVNTLRYQGGGGYERIYIPITVEKNKDYTFRFNLHSPTGFSMGGYGHDAEFAFIRTSAPSDTGGALDKTNLAVSANWNTTASETPIEYTIPFNSGNHTTLYVALDFGYILDGVTSEFVFGGIALDDGVTGVKRLAYIESTGVQYINTGIIPTVNTRVELKCAFREVNSQDVYMILTGDNYGLPWVDRPYDCFNWGWLGFGGPSTEHPTKDQIYVFEAFADNVPVVVINGNRYEGTSITPFSTNVEMHLFAFGGNPTHTALSAKAAVYYCRIWEGNRIVRDFIPVLDSNNVACLYDNVTESYFYNQGTGNFVAGPQHHDYGYIIKSGSTLYTITDGALTALAETEITASLFQTYGVNEISDGALLATLTDPEVLYWQDSEDELPTFSLTVKGTPPLPQMFTSGSMDLTHESISGIDHAVVSASEDVRFAVSFDDGATWQAHDGAAWFTVSDTAPGMLAATMNAITAEQWAEVVQLTAYRLRFWLPNVTAFVKSVVIHYINP